MGQPQLTNPPTKQENVSNVLTHVSGQHDELEKRLIGLRDKLQVSPMPTSTAEVAPIPGLVAHAMSIRNSGSRLLDLVSNLEALI